MLNWNASKGNQTPIKKFERSNQTRLKKFSPRPRGKSVIGKILFEYMIKVEKVLFSKSVC